MSLSTPLSAPRNTLGKDSTASSPTQRDDKTNWPAVGAATAGLAFWWPCVFQADFNTTGLAQLDAAYAPMRFAFPFALLLITAICAYAARRCHLRAPGAAYALLGCAGLAGYALQASSGFSSFRARVPLSAPIGAEELFFCIGAAISAFYLVTYLIIWLGLARFAPKSALPLAVAASYLACEAIQLLAAATPVGAQIAFRLACPVISTLGLLACRKLRPASSTAPAFPTGDSPSRRRRAQCLGLCLGMALLFACFGDFFSHAISMRLEQPGSGFSRSIPIPLASFAVMALLFVVLSRCDVAKTRYPLTAVLLLSVLFMAVLLFAILVSFEQASAADQLLIALGHCFKTGMLIMLAWACVNEVLPTTSAACLHVTLAVSLPLLVQNYFEVPLVTLVDIESIFVQLAGVGLFAIAVVVIGVVALPNKQEGARSAEDQLAWLNQRCRAATAYAGLTPKEAEAIAFAYRGFTTKRAAESMGVSPSTVDTHLRHAYRKLSIHSRQELIDLVDRTDAVEASTHNPRSIGIMENSR